MKDCFNTGLINQAEQHYELASETPIKPSISPADVPSRAAFPTVNMNRADKQNAIDSLRPQPSSTPLKSDALPHIIGSYPLARPEERPYWNSMWSIGQGIAVPTFLRP